MNIKQIKLAPRGFTLLEVVVAAAVFTVLATMSYASVNNILKSKEIIDQAQSRAIELQRTYGLLKNDLRFAVLRSVRDELGDGGKPFVINEGGSLLRLTAHYPDDVSGQLSRVVWELSGGAILRKYYAVLDRVEGTELFQRELVTEINKIKQLDVYAYEKDKEKVVRRSDWDNSAGLPLAVEFVVELDSGQSYRWLFDLPLGY